jgi:hypothetical protein
LTGFEDSKGNIFPSGTGFVTPSLTFLKCLSKAVAFNQRKTFRTGQHAPPAVISISKETYMTELYETLKQKKASILDIAKNYHAVNIRVFGSVIRGEEREDSDIDLLVDFLPGTTLLDQVGLIDALSIALGRKVDIVSERALNKHLRQRILQEAVPL